jgi:P27 family predicted phage terminase small subunit
MTTTGPPRLRPDAHARSYKFFVGGGKRSGDRQVFRAALKSRDLTTNGGKHERTAAKATSSRAHQLIQGRPGKRRLRRTMEVPTPPQVPEPPTYLTGHALTEWHRISGELYKCGLLTVLDVAVLAAYCDTVGRWRTAGEALEAMPAGERYTTPAGLTLLRIERQASELMVRFGSQCGIGPLSRTRLAVPPPRPPSKFDGLIG